MSENVLEIKDLKAYYRILKGDVKALDGISFNVKRGEILGVAGESGCGKSTLASALMLRKPPLKYISGEANLLGTNIMTLPEKKFRPMRMNNISIIPQYALDAFSPTKKIRTFISDLVSEHGIKPNRKFFEKVRERLEMINLDPSTLDRYSVELSGGMKQRMIMIISTLLDPDFIIADEITSALDVSSQRFVANMLVKLRDEKIIGSSIFITHDLSILYQIAERILIMYAGHFAEIGPTDELVKHAKHPYTRALIASLPQVGIQYKDKALEGIKGTPPHLLNIGEGCRFRFRCPYKTEKCEKTPEREKISENHYVSCWNWRETMPKGGE
ncbi:MAG TPA: ABC transporter ATP-binding protein [Thermotogota bacterium]|nr:ABC transporter ATP-binding protein [Thermotogota bacterium]HPJ88362.1 ABC transporter ATP-binding protein [Thermotogota bacterium]HPR95470.1 ABC transporter ATP-binding protein [Thermotogota bacterium]